MPDVSLTEFAIIAIVVLVVFGPKRLPELSRKAGEWARELRNISREFRRGIEREVAVINEPLQEIKEDLKGPLDEIKRDLKGPLDQLKNDLNAPVQEISKDIKDLNAAATAEWVGPVAPIGPTPDEAMQDLERIEAGESLLRAEDSPLGAEDGLLGAEESPPDAEESLLDGESD